MRRATFFASVLAMLVFAGSALAEVANERFPVAFEFDNPCTGETVRFEGFSHTLLIENETDMTIHLSARQGDHVAGTSESGARYVATFRSGFNAVIHKGQDVAGVTEAFHFNARRLGPDGGADDDFIGHLIINFRTTLEGEELHLSMTAFDKCV